MSSPQSGGGLSPVGQLLQELDDEAMGRELYAFVEAAYPICRSITGDGVRQTLRFIDAIVPLEVQEVPTGSEVFDWTVPDEWNAREAWIRTPSGERIADFQQHNLHLLNYSEPVHRKMSLGELRPHLHSSPEQPDHIPYRTSYFKRQWGFCLPHRQLETLQEGEYEVYIDSSLEPGSLTYGESFLPGRQPETVHLSAHVCHPSLANDNLSALAVVATVGRLLEQLSRKKGALHYSYRCLFAPGTIGAIAWLARNRGAAGAIRHGIVAANLGDGGCFHYKRSRQGDSELDMVVEQVLKDSGEDHGVEDFLPFGYDERQYCSPGFDLAVGSLTRTPWGRYPEYHTSGDNLQLVRPEHLASSLRSYLQVIQVLEDNRRYRNVHPHCEPQLGRRGLYNLIGGRDDGREHQLALLWVLNLSDGKHSLLDICRRSGMTFRQVLDAVHDLRKVELLEPVEDSP